MKVEVKKIDDCTRELKFEIPKERVKKTLDSVFNNIAKHARVKGYRKGKAPRNVLESSHGKVAEDETLKQLIPEVYQEGIKQENLEPLDMPDIQDVKFAEGEISFKATLDIKPEVKVKDYKGVKVVRKSSKVTKEDLDKTLDMFKKGQGEGKDVTIDDDFAKGLGYPNLKEFKESLSRQIELDKDRQNKFDLESQIIEKLLKGAKLATPKSLVKRQLEKRVAEGKERMKQQGMPAEEVDKKEEEMRKELAPAVEKDIKVYLILDKIAELENIEIKEGENLPAKVMEFLLKEAKWEEGK